MIKAMLSDNNADAQEIASFVFGNGLIYADISDYDYQSRLINAMPINLRLDYENGLQIINKQPVKAVRPSKDWTPKKCLRCQMFNAESLICQASELEDVKQADCLPDINADYVLPIEIKDCNKKKYNPFSWIAKARKCSIQDAISVKHMADIISSGNNETFQYCINNLTFDELVLLSDNLNDVEPDVSDANLLTYGYDEFEYNHLERCDVATSGHYALIDNKADLYKTAKKENKVDFNSFQKHKNLLTDIQESCQEYKKSLEYIEKGRIEKAKMKSRLRDITYKNAPKPAWMTPDRLAGLWQAVR